MAWNDKPPDNKKSSWDNDPPTTDELKKAEKSLISLKGLAQGAMESLPVVGAIGGGALGAVGGPGGAVLGAGLGGAAGGSLKSFIEGLSEKKTYGDVAKAPLEGSIQGLSGEMGGQVLGKAISKIPSILPKGNITQIEDAAKRLGVKATPGMTSQGDLIPGLENSIGQGLTPGGYLIKKQQEPINKAIKSNIDDLLKNASSLSKYESGNLIKKDLLQDISEKHVPISQVYNEIQESTKNMVLNPLGQARIAKNIRSIAEANLIPGSSEQKIAEQFASGIENIKNVDQLKLLNSRAKSILRDQTASAPEKQVVAQIVNKIENYQNNSIMRNAISSARNKNEGGEIAHEIVSDLKDANAAYRSMIEQLKTLGQGSKLTSGKYGISNITREIDEIPSEKIPDMLFRTENNDFLNFIKEDYPAIYETAKEQKLSEIMKKSIDPSGDVNPRKFMQSIKNLGPEVKEHLFGNSQKLSDVKTLIEAIPPKIGASDTPRGLSYLDLLNPVFQGMELGRYGAYKGAQSIEPIKQSLESPAARALYRATINKSNQPEKSKR